MKYFWVGLVWITVSAALLCLIEGASSFGLIALYPISWLYEGHRLTDGHYRTDPYLGWTNIPSTHISKLYRDDAGVTIDRFGFRWSEQPETGIESRFSAVCVGDSFTFGFGVGDNETWCRLLHAMLPRMYTYNMGVSGYGVDQMYLRYMADSARVKHSVVFFAFIADDIARMQGDSFLGLPKPLLVIRNGKVQTVNTPLGTPILSRWVSVLPWVWFRSLQTVKFARALAGASDERIMQSVPKDTQQVLKGIVEDLEDQCNRSVCKIVFVLLPTKDDYTGNSWKTVRDLFSSFSYTDNAQFVSLVEDLWSIPPQEIESYFIRHEDSPNYIADGHYTIKGNRFIAEHLLKKTEQLLKKTATNSVE